MHFWDSSQKVEAQDVRRAKIYEVKLSSTSESLVFLNELKGSIVFGIQIVEFCDDDTRGARCQIPVAVSLSIYDLGGISGFSL